MKPKQFHIIFFLILIWNCSFSQNYTNYTIADGLPSNHVYKLTQDYKGFIWFATDKGLVKYNGSTFKNFTTKDGLATNDIWNILPTKDDKLWFLSKTSSLGYVKNDSVYNFKSDKKNEIFYPIFTSHLANEVILTSPSKSHRLIDNQWKTVLENKFRSDNFFLYVKHSNIKNIELIYPLDFIKIHTKSDESKEFRFKNRLSSIHKRGQITDSLFYWVDNKSYHILNLNTRQLHSKTFKQQLDLETVKHARINLINSQLQISATGFVGVLDNNFNIKNTFVFPEEVEAHFGLIDASGSVWVTSFNNGMYYFTKNKQEVIYQLENDKILDIKKVNTKLLVNVFNKGFYEYNSKTKTLKPVVLENDFFFDANYIEDTKTEYYLSNQAIYSIEQNNISKKQYVKDLDEDSDIFRQFVYFKNTIYAIFSTGIAKLNSNTYQVEEEYYQNGITQLLVLNNRLLIATNNGLKELKNNKIEAIDFENQFYDISILSLVKVSKNQFLINTDGFGSYITDLKTIIPLPKSEFLIANNAFVKENSLWLATDSGVLQYVKKDENFQYLKTFDVSSGLPTSQVNTVFVEDNVLIAGTNSGIITMPLMAEVTNKCIDLYVDAVYFNDTKISNNASFQFQDNNSLNVNVETIDFSNDKDKTSYHYKLKPVQDYWNISNTSLLNFNNLKPDNYTLYVKKNGKEKTFQFTIQPLWWQTLWFKTLLGCLITTLLVSTVWKVSQQIQKKKDQKLIQEKQLSEIQLKALRSQMNPHFVFNSLSAIQYYINENNYEASEQYLVKFSKLIRQFFELSKENEITLKDEIQLLKSYLEIEKLRFREKLDFQIKVDENLNVKETKIPTMLLQPIVENAVNHGVFNKVENGKVTIKFNVVNTQTIEVKIIDDGVGFANTKSKQKKHNSSNVIADRLKFLNQTGIWNITFENKELNSEAEDKGNQAIFIITNLR